MDGAKLYMVITRLCVYLTSYRAECQIVKVVSQSSSKKPESIEKLEDPNQIAIAQKEVAELDDEASMTSNGSIIRKSSIADSLGNTLQSDRQRLSVASSLNSKDTEIETARAAPPPSANIARSYVSTSITNGLTIALRSTKSLVSNVNQKMNQVAQNANQKITQVSESIMKIPAAQFITTAGIETETPRSSIDSIKPPIDGLETVLLYIYENYLLSSRNRGVHKDTMDPVNEFKRMPIRTFMEENPLGTTQALSAIFDTPIPSTARILLDKARNNLNDTAKKGVDLFKKILIVNPDSVKQENFEQGINSSIKRSSSDPEITSPVQLRNSLHGRTSTNHPYTPREAVETNENDTSYNQDTINTLKVNGAINA